jgi:hypothetical protein
MDEDIKLTIKRNRLTEEYIVRLHYKGKHQRRLDYFTPDLDDAKLTAEAMRKNFENILISRMVGNAKQKGLVE